MTATIVEVQNWQELYPDDKFFRSFDGDSSPDEVIKKYNLSNGTVRYHRRRRCYDRKVEHPGGREWRYRMTHEEVRG